MNSSNGHHQRLLNQINANRNSDHVQGPEMAEMGMQTDLRAGSPCRQAATEIMEDISMEQDVDNEAYRRDMINVFPGHPALPQQTHSMQGDFLLDTQRELGAPGATMIGNYGAQNGGPLYEGPVEAEDNAMMDVQGGASEPDWITQMLEQVQKVGLWNEPIPEEPARVSELPEVTAGAVSTQCIPRDKNVNIDPIPFYKANIESLLTQTSPTGPQNTVPDMTMPNMPNTQPVQPSKSGTQRAATADIKVEQENTRPYPTMNPVMAFSVPSQEGGVGVIGQNQSRQSADYIHLIRNALNVPGLALRLQNNQAFKINQNRSISLELSNDGIKEVLASTQQDRLNDGPFRPPTKAPHRHLGTMRSLDSNLQRPLLQQSKLQLELGLAADTPIDLRKWGYGGNGRDTGNGHARSHGKRSLSSEGLHAVGSSAEITPSQFMHARPDASGCTTADSLMSAGGPSSAVQNSAEFNQKSLNSGSIEFGQPQGSDKKPGLSADDVTRLESLERYREKKRRRLYTKTIRYHKRKVNADARKRYKGRFVKAETSGQGFSKDSGEQVTDPGGHGHLDQSMEASDLRTV